MLSGRSWGGHEDRGRDEGHRRAGQVYISAGGAGGDSLPAFVWCNGVPTTPTPNGDFDSSFLLCGQFKSKLNRALWWSLKQWPSEISALGSVKLQSARRVLLRRPMSPLPRHWWVLSSPICGAALREAGWPWSVAQPAQCDHANISIPPPHPHFPPHS